MKKLPLSKGMFALLDDEDFARLSQFKWHYQGKYAARYDKTASGKRVYLHREIMDAPQGAVVDHINRDPLDCRKENLRLCTYTENSFNRVRNANPGHSQYKGVTFNKQRGLWRAKITANGKGHYLGDFQEELHAVIAYTAAARVLQGNFALSFDPLA